MLDTDNQNSDYDYHYDAYDREDSDNETGSRGNSKYVRL